MKYFVYCTINLKTNKKYIGSHKGKINDTYLGSGDLISKSVLKYGKENFKREILEITENRKGAFLLEEKYIKEYNTIKPRGYNLSPTGGMGNWGGEHSKETRKRLSEKRMGKEPWNKSKIGIYSEWALQRMRENSDNKGENNPMYGRKGKNSPIYGIKKTEEHKQKFREQKLGGKNPNACKYFIQTPDGKEIIVNSATEFIRDYPKYEINRHFIYGCSKSLKGIKGWIIKKINS